MKTKLNRKIQKSIIGILTFVMAFASCMYGHQMTASAASYAGSGTQQDPYLVQTAEQLDGMRDKPSAHYKLANTIDMSSYGKIAPIGNEGAKFTGSFTCDTNADGTPKYAIKNLKIYIDAGEKYGHKHFNASSYSDFVLGKNKWQAGLFGYTEGATLKNIAVFGADVTNTVLGQNDMNPDWSRNPGQNEPAQSTGILVGSAVNTTIIGCMASGKVNSKSNNTGGLIGYMVNGSVSNSYCTANVTNSGYWGTGGLIGICDSGSVSSCFASGNVSGGPTEATTGGLIGQVTEGSTAIISNCYSTGSVSPDANGFSIFGFRIDFKNYEPSWAMNCYTTSAVAGFSNYNVGTIAASSQNLFALSGVKGRQDGFVVADKAAIKAAFSGLPDWDTSGDLPKLTAVHIIADESKYVPGAVTDVPQTSTPQAGTTTDTSTEEVLESVDVKALVELMSGLPDVDSVTLKNLKDIKQIKRDLESLSEADAEQVPAEAQQKYKAAYDAIIPLVMADISERVQELPKLKKINISHYKEVMELYENYEFIGENSEFMDEEIVSKLLAAVEKVKELKESGATVPQGISLVEWILIGVLSFFILCVLALNVVWVCMIAKRYKKIKKTVETESEGEGCE